MSNMKFYFILLAFAIVSCKDGKSPESSQDVVPVNGQDLKEDNTLTETEKAEGWVLLFDGMTTGGWHLYNKPEAKPVWAAADGVLACDPLNGTGEHGDLVSDKAFENYDFKFEWKITESGNSGVFINVQEDPEFQQAWFTGPEYQLLDAGNKDYELVEKRSGCLYGFASQITSTSTKPLGEWNSSRIKQVDGKVEFYLNGNLTAKVDFNSNEWKDFVANSGFKNFPQFGASTMGHITLQEWTSPIWFRNLKIKEL